MTNGAKWFLGISLLVVAGAIIIGARGGKRPEDDGPGPKQKESSDTRLTEADWKALLKAGLDAEKRSKKPNAISKLTKSPALEASTKVFFLNNGTRSELDTIMPVITSNKQDAASVSKRNQAILNFITQLATKK